MRIFGRREENEEEERSQEIVRDCEAFLSGHFAEYLEGSHRAVPAWAWVNLLAHGTHQEMIQAESQTGSNDRPETRNWRRSRAFLAAEVLALVGGPEALQSLQQRVLQPLELELAAASDADGWRPHDLASHVSAVLLLLRSPPPPIGPPRHERGNHSA